MLDYCLDCKTKWDPKQDLPECEDPDHEHATLLSNGEDPEEETNDG